MSRCTNYSPIARNMQTEFNIGFVGTGAIAEALIVGLLSSGSQLVKDSSIRISRRNAQRSNRLKELYPNIEVVDSNQEIADQSDWNFIAVLPEQARSVLEEIEFDPQSTIISLVAGMPVNTLRELTGCQNSMRIVPLPPVEMGLGPIPIFPPNQSVEALLNEIGSAVPLGEEKELSACATASAMMATYFELVAKISSWLNENGVSSANSASYASNMLHALAATTVDKDLQQLKEMSDECLTTGGLNEQVLFNKRESGWFNSINENLDLILKRISK